uniref:Major capsid protein N-terminal domain-containing protein n=1 Tax=viral metagenome TaxID=1070528 RepID=A0A6C0EKA0_9ZZZZ
MGGGLLQLSAYGSENEYINGNPQITFFKTVYRRYTNFSIQSIEIPLEGSHELSYENTIKLKTKIPRNADLVKNIFLEFTLPDIFSSEEDEFFWVRGIGPSMINYIDIFIGGNKIERISGKYIWNINNLTTKGDKQFLVDKMIGNESDLSYTHLDNNRYVGSDNTKYKCNKKISKFYKTHPSIFGRVLTIPIPFWFTKNTGLAVPLISLQYHEINIEIDFKPIKDLYTIKKKDKMYYYYKNNEHYMAKEGGQGQGGQEQGEQGEQGEEESYNAPNFQSDHIECEGDQEEEEEEEEEDGEVEEEEEEEDGGVEEDDESEINMCIAENDTSKLTFNNLDKNSMYNKKFQSNTLKDSVKHNGSKFINKIIPVKNKLSNIDSWDLDSSTTINDTITEEFNIMTDSLLNTNDSSLIGDNTSLNTNDSSLINSNSVITDTSSNINTNNHIAFNNSFQKKLNTLENKVYNITDVRENAFLEDNLGEYTTYVRKKPESNKNDHISNFIYGDYREATWDHNATLIVEYIFLDIDERKIFAKQGQEYLIEQVVTIETLDILPKSQICLELYHPVKEILFTFNRNDNDQRNEWLNYTSLPHNITDKSKNYQYYLQNGWWFDCCETAQLNPIKININNEDIECDRFQELLFRYGPYGEAGDPSSILLDFNIENTQSLYTLEEIKEFKQVWLFTKACCIPIIDKYNFNNYVLNPLKTMEIKFNGSVREDRKTFNYYSYIQPYMYHTKATCEPIYTYSFSLEPEKYQPSGSCNFSRLNNIVFDIELQETPINTANVKLGKNVSRDYEYNAEFYIVNYNILRISNGMAGTVFSN